VIPTSDVIIRLTDLPFQVKGLTVLDENGDYNIYLNPMYSHETQKEVLEHELGHIEENHFYCELSIKEKEWE